VNPAKIFPCLLILLNLCASVACFYAGDPKRGVYWLAAATLNVCVTF
jgi:hypothetical protein